MAHPCNTQRGGGGESLTCCFTYLFFGALVLSPCTSGGVLGCAVPAAEDNASEKFVPQSLRTVQDLLTTCSKAGLLCSTVLAWLGAHLIERAFARPESMAAVHQDLALALHRLKDALIESHISENKHIQLSEQVRVLLTTEHNHPELGNSILAFLDELRAQGLENSETRSLISAVREEVAALRLPTRRSCIARQGSRGDDVDNKLVIAVLAELAEDVGRGCPVPRMTGSASSSNGGRSVTLQRPRGNLRLRNYTVLESGTHMLQLYAAGSQGTQSFIDMDGTECYALRNHANGVVNAHSTDETAVAAFIKLVEEADNLACTTVTAQGAF